jgi:hypothetical protein
VFFAHARAKECLIMMNTKNSLSRDNPGKKINFFCFEYLVKGVPKTYKTALHIKMETTENVPFGGTIPAKLSAFLFPKLCTRLSKNIYNASLTENGKYKIYSSWRDNPGKIPDPFLF